MKLIMIAGLATMTVSAALAQHNHGASTPSRPPAPMQHGGHAGHAMAPAAANEASQALAAANAKMHKDLAIAFTGNADADFARGMIPHHQGAVDMAEIVLKFGKDEEVRKLATSIVAAQKAEISQMQTWLQKNSAASPGPKARDVIAAYEAINAEMHKEMNAPMSGNPDVDFMAGMVPHHEAAVDMAKVLLRHGKDAELRKLAEDVVRSQSAEIVSMLDWLRRNGG